ncbi:glycosyltransferase family 2 protein [Peribacillus butanolivorans]|uniref:glycosyltransferase family 2 protein n=1 Tax=Peribacillus butanolivorans TaxID=421767 RepID=UPI00366D5C7F
MKISVIIPAYNVEEYIEKCLDSLVSQLFTDFEVILINDGSTDRTKDILEEYSNQHKFIRVYNITNKGVSNARNLGLLYSRGDYITFCDADDWFDVDVLEKVFETISRYQGDLVVYGRRDILSDSRSFSYNDHNEVKVLSYKKSDYLKEVFSIGKHTFSVCNKVYRKEILSQNEILFDTDLKLSEDTLFNLKYLAFAESIIEDYRTSYNRIYREGSAIYIKIDNFYNENIKIIEMFRNYINSKNVFKPSDYQEGLLQMYYLYGKVSIFRNCDKIDGENNFIRVRNIFCILNDSKFQFSLKHIKGKNLSFREKIFYYLSKRKRPITIYIIFGLLVKIKGFVSLKIKGSLKQ